MSDSEESPTPAKVAKLSTSITEISSDFEPSSVDSETQRALTIQLQDIDSCQGDIDALYEKGSEEVLKVEMKYNKLRRPHFEKRNNLIKYIPNFWVTSFLNHPRMANFVEEEEEECLHYLKQVDVQEFEDIKSGYTIKFEFATNPYFTNEVLTKEYHLMATEGKLASRTTKIHWKPNMDLTRSTQAKNVRRPRGPNRSFFWWLSESIDPSKDSVAEMIKDELWPNPLQYFLASEIEVEENGIESDDDDDDDDMIEDDSVVIVGDDDDDVVESEDDDVYEVKDDDDEDDYSGEELEETVESIEVEDDDDDDDAIEILGSDSEAELLQETSEISCEPEESAPSTNIVDEEADTSKDKNSEAEPETLQTSEPDSEKTSKSEVKGAEGKNTSKSEVKEADIKNTQKSDVKEGDSEKLLDDDKNGTDADDVMLDSDNLVSQNDDSVLLDNDENDSDLLKEDDDDDGGDTNVKKKDTNDAIATNNGDVADEGKKAEDGVD